VEQVEQREFYHYGFQELCEERGEALALEKVAHYQQLSKQYAACGPFIVHRCKLLSTYQNPTLAPEPPLMNTLVSVFYRPITNTTHQKQLTLHSVVNLIRSGVFKHETDKLRTISKSTTGKKKDCPNSTYKRTAFSYATFSGTFTSRDDKALSKHSGLICIDIDDLGERLLEIRDAIIADPATVVCFFSPNGDGLKVLYEMDPAKYSQYDWYKGYCIRLSKDFGVDVGKLDPSCKNVSRACFLPHDPNIFINPSFVTT
jgi:hypothetical protein